MRQGVGLFGLVCSAIIIAVAARYGYKTSDSDFDGYIWAFIYGAITFAGLFGHMVAVRLWRRHRMRWVSTAVFIVCILTLVISLSNSIGAMAGRANTTQAARVKTAEAVRVARRDLERVQDERERMKFEPTDWSAVEAARNRAKAATGAKEAECNVRGQRCRDKEDAEVKALAESETASKNKAATEHARELDAQIEKLTAKIAETGPVLEANSQGSALARLFDLPDDKADRMSTYQNLGMGVVLELIVAFSLIIYELMTEGESLQKTAPAFAPASSAAVIELEPEKAAALPAPVIEPEPTAPEELAEEEETKAFPVPSRPRLIASRPDPVGSVTEILTETMEKGGRGKLEIREIFKAYSETCRAQGKRSVSETDFPAPLAEFCKANGIKTEISDGRAYLLKVRLKKSGKNCANA